MKSFIIMLSVVWCSLTNAQILPDMTSQSVQMDQHAVSNKDWSVFLKFIKSAPDFSKEYLRSMIPHQWTIDKTSLKNQNSPVTGISWAQAVAYCQWKSEVSTYLNAHNGLAPYRRMQAENKRVKTMITYRLPTGNEWRRSGRTTKAVPGSQCVYLVRITT